MRGLFEANNLRQFPERERKKEPQNATPVTFADSTPRILVYKFYFSSANMINAARRVTLGNLLLKPFFAKVFRAIWLKKLASSPASGKHYDGDWGVKKTAQFQSSIFCFGFFSEESASTQYFEILIRNTKSKHLGARWRKRPASRTDL